MMFWFAVVLTGLGVGILGGAATALWILGKDDGVDDENVIVWVGRGVDSVDPTNDTYLYTAEAVNQIDNNIRRGYVEMEKTNNYLAKWIILRWAEAFGERN